MVFVCLAVDLVQVLLPLTSDVLFVRQLDVDVVDLRAQADASMPASNNNVKLYNISNF